MANRGAFLTVAPIPSGDTAGGAPNLLYHQKVTCDTLGAGTYLCAHGLPYTPTLVWVIAEEAEGTTAPAATVAAVSWCPADTDGTNVAINIPATTAQTYHIVYG